MRNLTTVEYLSQIKDIDLRIRSLEGELNDISEEDEEYADELCERIRADVNRLKKVRLMIRDQIQGLGDNRSVVLLMEYYVRGKSWEQVTAAVGMKSVKHVRTGMHIKALRQFESKYKKFFSSL